MKAAGQVDGIQTELGLGHGQLIIFVLLWGCLQALHHFGHNLLPTIFPFFAILHLIQEKEKKFGLVRQNGDNNVAVQVWLLCVDVTYGIVEIFGARHTKDPTMLQLLS